MLNSSDPSARHYGAVAERRRVLPWSRLLFAAPYAALLFWFHGVDAYHRHFSESGLIVLAYNCCRALYVFYLFWMVEAAGSLLLRAIAAKELAETAILERLTLGFFTGAGLLHAILLVLGYAGLYTLPVAIGCTLPLVLLSYSDFSDAIVEIRHAPIAIDCARNVRGMLGLILLGLIGAALILLFLVKGLYPGGGHDYFTHYFYYFEAVVAHHGLWPNEVWYHYYYDKGAGLYFLSILLTDPLAPQLVTFCFMTAAAVVIFLGCRDAAPGTHWPLVAVLLFLIIFAYTPDWGEFEKTHELAAALVIAVFWTAARAFARCGHSTGKLYFVATSAAIAASVIVTPTIAVFLGGVFGLSFLSYLVAGKRRHAAAAFLFAVIVGLLLSGTFALNYLTTGLLSDQVLLSTWSISNLEKLDRWGVLIMVISEYQGLLGMLGDRLPLSQVPGLLDHSSRLKLIYPLIDIGLIIAIVAFSLRLRTGRRSEPLRTPHQAAILLAAVPVFIGIAMTVGRVQSISFYRYASFAVPIILVGGVTLWGLPISSADRRFVHLVRDQHTPAVVLGLCLLTFCAATPPARLFNTYLPRVLRYAAGAMSIDTAYTLQPSHPLYPLNGIYSGARGAYAVVGPGTPIWSFHIHSYCMLPDCRVESWISFLLPHDRDVMFGSPAVAQRALQASGLNYFLFSRELPIFDPLPLSPLFSPDNIARYLGVRWTDGTTALLTWLGPGVQPLNEAWLSNYREAVEHSATVRGYPYDATKQFFARLESMPRPWPSIPIPGTRN